MRNALLLSYQGDLHADAVERELRRRSIRTLRLATERIGQDFQLTFISADLRYQIDVADDVVDLDAGWSIWNRRILDPTSDPRWRVGVADIVQGETRRTWDAMLAGHAGLVVSRPDAVRRAEDKLGQIAFARGCGAGVDVPDTIVTNDPVRVREFYDRHDGNICFKLQKGASVERDGQTYFVYTNKVTKEHLRHVGAIRAAPALFQEYVPKAHELRITVVGETVIGVAIYSQDSPISQVDFRRYDFARVRYERATLSHRVAEFCRAMLRHYGLEFGAFDFIVAPDGRYVFLEVNPNGQWLWLEQRCGAPISQSLADHLSREQ